MHTHSPEIRPHHYLALQKACRLGGPQAPHLHIAGCTVRPLVFSCLPIVGPYSQEPPIPAQYDLTVCLAGSVTQLTGDRILPMRAGEVCLIPPGVPYRWQTGKEGAFLLWAQFTTDVPLQMAGSIVGAPLPRVLQDVAAILEEVEHGLLGWQERIGWRWTLILGQALPLTSGSMPLPAPPLLNDYLPNAVDQYLRDHLTQPVRLDDLAEALQLSVRTLVRRYKADHGGTIMARLRQLRLEQAEELLRTTTLSLDEVARHVGIPEKSHFCRLFHAHYGDTPMRYHRRVWAPRHE
jgi:AraC-like DNA-binding protein